MIDIYDEPRACSEVTLTKLYDECSPRDPLAQYQLLMRDWAATYLTAPHPALGRDGVVCPYTAASINRETFWVGCVDSPDLTAEDIEGNVVGMVTKFSRLSPAEGPGALLKTVLILFPAVADYGVIDEAQRRLKERFISQGLMIGQFYPGCAEPGLPAAAVPGRAPRYPSHGKQRLPVYRRESGMGRGLPEEVRPGCALHCARHDRGEVRWAVKAALLSCTRAFRMH
jgi:hypothetical protein